MLKFKSEVRIAGSASVAEAAERLDRLIAPPRSFASEQRLKPLRGRLSLEKSFVRWRFDQYRAMSPRTLHFRVVPGDKGAVVTGAFRLWMPFRIIVLTFMIVGMVSWALQVRIDLHHQAGANTLFADILALLLGPAMGLGYTWFFVRVGRTRDQQLVAILRSTLQSREAALTVESLFATKHVRFVDEEA